MKIILNIVLIFQLSYCFGQISYDELVEVEKARILTQAKKYLKEKPVTVTSYICERSQGGKHDFYSEGDYWWPNPDDLNGPYIRRDGESNPNNFVVHRQAMRNMSMWVPSLVAAYKITRKRKYALRAIEHLNAWFIDEETKMNPSLLYAQAIKGRVSGRGIGIIDTIHLIEVVKAIEHLKESKYVTAKNYEGWLAWFEEYTTWLTTHEYGIDERDHGNNHSAWWVAQVAAFSSLTGNNKHLNFCRELFKNTILPNQIDSEGIFKDEITRTKPYSYSLFNLEAFALICQLLSTDEENLWNYNTKDGKSIKIAFSFMFPFIIDKTKWPYPPDIAYFEKLPVRGSALFFGGMAYNKANYLEIWKTLESDPTEQELIRTFVIRQPILWL